MLTDIDECGDSIHNCHTDAECANKEGGFICTCNAGYIGNGTACTGNDVTGKNCLNTFLLERHNCVPRTLMKDLKHLQLVNFKL